MLIRPAPPAPLDSSPFGNQKVADAFIEPDPIFSVLNMASANRGHAALPQSITIGETTVEGKVWIAEDYDSVAGDWDEHWSATDCGMSEAGTPGSVAASFASAGGLASKALTANGSWRFLADVAGKADPGTDDFVICLLGAPSASRMAWCSTLGGVPATGMYQYRISDGRWNPAISDGSAGASWNIANSRDASLFWIVCDRSYATGVVAYRNGTMINVGDPTSITGTIGGNKMMFMGGWSGASPTGVMNVLPFEAFGIWHAADLLDLSNTFETTTKLGAISAEIMGRAFTVFQGSAAYPTVEQTTTRDFDIDGTPNTLCAPRLHPLESSDGSAVYAKFAAANSQAWDIPSDNIPTGGNGAFRFRLNVASKPGSEQPIFSVHADAADELKATIDTDGHINVSAISTAGDNGSISGTTDVTGSDVLVEVQQLDGKLTLRLDGAVEGTDTTSTWPASPDTFLLAKDAAGAFATVAFREGENYGLHAYDERLF